jgi:hypothetical protein
LKEACDTNDLPALALVIRSSKRSWHRGRDGDYAGRKIHIASEGIESGGRIAPSRISSSRRTPRSASRLAVVISAHVGGALFHYFIRKDRVLMCILTG